MYALNAVFVILEKSQMQNGVSKQASREFLLVHRENPFKSVLLAHQTSCSFVA